MAMRLRYKKSSFNVLTTKPILVKNNLLVINLLKDSLTYNIVDFDTGEIIESGEATSMAALKKVAKKKLESLGKEFEKEFRKKMPL